MQSKEPSDRRGTSRVSLSISFLVTCVIASVGMGAAGLAWCVLGASRANADTLMLTQHNDSRRSGFQQDTILKTSNVGAKTFGKLFTRELPPSSIDILPKDRIYTQPLIWRTPSKQKLVIVATHSNNVYAYDAEDPQASNYVWTKNLGLPEVSKNGDWSDDHCNNSLPAVGVLSTPVIVPQTGMLYVVAKRRNSQDYTKKNDVGFTIFKLDASTGAILASAPILQRPGTGGPVFNPYYQLQRASLVWVPNAQAPGGGFVYAAFGAHCDVSPYQGWIFGVNGDLGGSPQIPNTIFTTAPNGNGAGIWQAGQAPIHARLKHEDFLFVSTGNGSAQLANSVLKLKVHNDGSLSLADSFTPYNQAALTLCDADLASAGPSLSGTNARIVLGGKEGVLYVLNTDVLGHAVATDNQPMVPSIICKQNMGGGGFEATYQWNPQGDAVFQEFRAAKFHIHGSPVHAKGADGVTRLYVWSEEDNLKAFKQLSSGKFDASSPAQSTVMFSHGMPGGALSLSGSAKTGSVIVWATHPNADAWTPPNLTPVEGTLYAFDGKDVSKLLWQSSDDPADALGEYSKFTAPTISDGRVYVATFDGRIQVYGLRKKPP
jgi:outer membrane protein assembly factor BamB